VGGKATKSLKSPRQNYEFSGDAIPVQTLVKYWNADRAGRTPKVEYKAGEGREYLSTVILEYCTSIIHGLETVQLYTS